MCTRVLIIWREISRSSPGIGYCFIRMASWKLKMTSASAFGDSKLEQILRTYHAQLAAKLSEHVLTEPRNW